MARLKDRYNDEIRPQLIERFGYTSAMQAPRLQKITLNMGVGDAKQDSKVLEAATEGGAATDGDALVGQGGARHRPTAADTGGNAAPVVTGETSAGGRDQFRDLFDHMRLHAGFLRCKLKSVTGVELFQMTFKILEGWRGQGFGLGT